MSLFKSKSPAGGIIENLASYSPTDRLKLMSAVIESLATQVDGQDKAACIDRGDDRIGRGGLKSATIRESGIKGWEIGIDVRGKGLELDLDELASRAADQGVKPTITIDESGKCAFQLMAIDGSKSLGHEDIIGVVRGVFEPLVGKDVGISIGGRVDF